MFAVRDGKSCLTDGILRRKEDVEQVVRGKKALYEIADNLMEYSDAAAAPGEDDDDEGGQTSRPDAVDYASILDVDELD